MGTGTWRNVIVAVAVVAVLAAWTAPALAANQIYWAQDINPGLISAANLDGSGGGVNVTTGSASVDFPFGTAINPATNKVYWTNFGSSTISFADLDGGGGGNLNTTGTTVMGPEGVAIDPVTNKIYWANTLNETISFANLDDTGGGGTLNITGATQPDGPRGVAINPATNKIYWASTGNSLISFANLDDTGGGGDLNATGVTPAEPDGLAIDPSANKIFWADFGSTTISFANLDDTGGGGHLSTTGASTPNQPIGIAIDPGANKVYWGNHGTGLISFANEDNTGGGGNVNTTPLTPTAPDFPGLLEVPSATAAPTISGGSVAPGTLGCTQGSWASDLLGSFLYRAPRSLSFSWTLNGSAISGATASSITASSPGSYACRVTATNHAGSTTQTSSPHTVAAPPPPLPLSPPTGSIASVSRSGSTELVTLACNGAAGEQCTAKVVGTVKERKRANTIVAVTAANGKRHGGKPKTKTVTVTVVRSTVTLAAGKSVTTRIALNGAGTKLLARFQRLPVSLSFTGSIATTQTVVYTLSRLHVTTPTDSWFNINLPCSGSQCYSMPDKVPITGLPARTRISVTCVGRGCPFSRRSFTARKHQFDLASALRHSQLQPGTVVTAVINAPNEIGTAVRYTIRRGTGPLRVLLCLAPGTGRPGPCT
jgi:DNA-binding beta-propeller fold protein YncE